jgi:signal transduction histidine kinase
MNVMTVSGLAILLTCYSLSLLVFLYSNGRQLNMLWALFNLAVGTWGLGLFGVGLSDTPAASLFWWKMCYVGGIYIGVVFLHVTYEFTGRYRPVFLRWVYAYSVLFLLACISGLAIARVERLGPHVDFYYMRSNVWHTSFLLIWFALVAYALWELYQYYRHAAGLRRKQSQLLFWGTFTGFAGGSLHLFVPWGAPMYPFVYGSFSVPIYSLIVTYAVLKHQLMDIKVVIKRTLQFAGLVGSVVAVVSVVAFVSQDVLARVVEVPKWLSNVLAAAIIAGVYGPVRNWLVDATDRYLFQKKYDYKELLKKFADEVMVMVDLKQLVEKTVNTLAETVKLDGCSLLLLNKDKRTYELAASQAANGQHIVLEEQEPFVTFLRQTHEPIGGDGQVRFPDAVTNRVKQLRARLCLPLSLHEELIGVLCLGKKKSDEDFAKDDLDILTPLARSLAIAISNAQLFDELAKTQAEAAQKEKLAVIGTLSAGINHEICNPLGIVKAQCEAFLLDLEDGILIGKSSSEVLDRTSNIMRVALKQIDRATAITQKLSNFAKPIKEPTAQPVSVEQEVDEVLLLVGHDLQLEKIEIIKDFHPALPSIHADRRQFQEVLFNLIRNAGQAIRPPGTIWVRGRLLDGQVRVEIADTGGGIPPDKLSKIYDPFFTTKEPGKGTGLGLFIVRQIVERNKGRISVESAVGKGTTFFLDFPVAAGALAGR